MDTNGTLMDFNKGERRYNWFSNFMADLYNLIHCLYVLTSTDELLTQVN